MCTGILINIGKNAQKKLLSLKVHSINHVPQHIYLQSTEVSHPSIQFSQGCGGVRCIPVVVLKCIIENFTQKRHFWSLKIAVLKNYFQEEKFEKPYVD